MYSQCARERYYGTSALEYLWPHRHRRLPGAFYLALGAASCRNSSNCSHVHGCVLRCVFGRWGFTCVDEYRAAFTPVWRVDMLCGRWGSIVKLSDAGSSVHSAIKYLKGHCFGLRYALSHYGKVRAQIGWFDDDIVIKHIDKTLIKRVWSLFLHFGLAHLVRSRMYWTVHCTGIFWCVFTNHKLTNTTYKHWDGLHLDKHKIMPRYHPASNPINRTNSQVMNSYWDCVPAL